MTRKPKTQATGAATKPKANESTKNDATKAKLAKSQAFSKSGRGQGVYEPGQADRLLVQLGVAAGMTHKQIAGVLQISVNTLARHFPEELENGADKANMRVVGNLFRIATQTQDQKAALSAAIWWTKARMGWRGDNGPALEGQGELNGAAPGTTVRFTLKIGDRADGSEG